MSTLEKPTPPQTETGRIPARKAGIFLTRTFGLGPGAEPPLTELVPMINSLEREGRLISQLVTGNQLTIKAIPNPAGEF